MKGKVLLHEIKKPPVYFRFSNGEFNNPQTHPVFLHFAQKYSWWSEWDFEFIPVSGGEITIAKITADLLIPEIISLLHDYGFEYLELIKYQEYFGK